MTFKGLLNHIDDITALCEDFPETKVIIDHFGFCSAAKPDGDDWKALYSLARFPQVFVKVHPAASASCTNVDGLPVGAHMHARCSCLSAAGSW
jgi:predicted TIM-barrel fold metal-dependent hydrolase